MSTGTSLPTLSQVWPQHALFWGKAGKPQEVKHPPYHSALLHMLDVGLVAHALLEAGWRRLFFDEPDRQQGLWLALLVACHDVGKISPGFQNKRSDLEIVQQQKRLGFQFSQNDDDDHGRVTLATLPKLLTEQTQSRLSIAHANQLARAVGGHHGVFHVDFNQARAGQGQWTDARRRLVETLRQAFGLDWSSFPFCAPPRPEFLIKLAGLTCLADWIGSQEDRFPYCGDADLDLDDYVTDRQQRVHAALAELHLTDAPLTAGESALEQLFTYLPGFTPNACQTVAWEVARRFDEPCLVVIEYPMGGGKTEAALGITDCWLHKRRLRGWYYALPTQATGNAMFERLLEFIRHHPARKGDVELHLLHGNADINESYEKLRQVSATAVYDADEHGGVRASGWFTARKRGLLASLGVGTIDQALLGVLQTRHMFVRLFGLAGKVVILDEVHAYDTYTSETLFRLVNWLGALGSSVIVLSATLPTDKRRALLKAYAPTLDESALPAAPYPGVMAVGRSNKVCSESIPIAETDRRAVQLELLEVASDARWEQLAALLTAKLIDGGCAACLVNTVSDAQELFVYLKQRLGCAMEAEWILVHARFPLEQRLAIEARIKALFGKDGRRPHRAVVVATQVMEQSLDVDFDLMFTVLAPVDLVLQRAGRLHRHQRRRPTGLDTATLYCLLPPHLESRPDFGESEFIL
ncbi:MAG: CRISPR-associated helicase Cas3' [Chloracidobacterium sp.]|nr:CRISPR-associated helicase Cas3' [Chloracidobacterium sp.]MDW8216643.1 CRISPR-associated helicase Cas3' [Acidobacteriota bacterium]